MHYAAADGDRLIVRRRVVYAFAAMCASTALPARAQQRPERIYRIGMLYAGSRSTGTGMLAEALRVALREHKYVEGRNLVIEERFAETKYESIPALAAELVRLDVDVIVSSGTPATFAAKNATTTIPIVMNGVGDAVGAGLIASLARPGGNITGVTIYSPELFAKRLDLMKEALPQIQRVAVLLNPVNPAQERSWVAIEPTARLLKIQLLRFEPRGRHEFEAVFEAMTRQRAEALVISNDTMFNANARAIAELAAKHRLPTIGPGAFAAAGALMSYGVLLSETDRRTAYFVVRVLKGAKPADLPVELPTRFELVVNLRTAKTLGLTLAQSIFARADRVIE